MLNLYKLIKLQYLILSFDLIKKYYKIIFLILELNN